MTAKTNHPSARNPRDLARWRCDGLPARGALWMRRPDAFDFGPHSLPAALFDRLRCGEPVAVPVCGATPDAALPGRVYPSAAAALDALDAAVRADSEDRR